MTRRSWPHLFLSALIILVLAGCVAPPTYPPPMLTPAINFVDRVPEVPEGWTLHISYGTVLDATGKPCRGPVIYGSSIKGKGGWGAIGCYFDGDRLHVYGTTLKTTGRSRILICTGTNRTRGGLSTIGAGTVQAVDWLPVRTYGFPTLRAVDKQGAVVVEIGGQAFYIYPGGKWDGTSETTDGNCDAT